MAMIEQPRPKKLGIFGGTFDPPHFGHVQICKAAVKSLSLDELVVVVANDPWQKSATVQATAPDRLAMAKAAFDTIDRVTVSDIEILRGGRSYMIETLEAFASTEHEMYLILGDDAASKLSTWHRAADLAELATVAAVARGGELSLPGPPFRCLTIDVERFDCQSSQIREMVASGDPIGNFVPAEVILEVAQRHLYTSA